MHRKKNYKYTVLDKTLEVDEEDGIIVRYLSSLAGTDSWHNKKVMLQIKKLVMVLFGVQVRDYWHTLI